MKWVAFICAAAIIGCAIPITVELTLLLRETRIDEDRISGEIIGAARTVSEAAGDQESYWKKEEPQMTKLLLDSTHLVGGLDVSFNGGLIRGGKQPGLIPELNGMIGEANAAITRFDRQTLPALGLLLTNGSDLVAHVDERTGDLSTQFGGLVTSTQATVEAITVDAQSANAALEPMARAAEEAHGAATNVNATTKDVRDWVHAETAPIKGAWAHIKVFLFELAGPLASVASAIK